MVRHLSSDAVPEHDDAGASRHRPHLAGRLPHHAARGDRARQPRPLRRLLHRPPNVLQGTTLVLTPSARRASTAITLVSLHTAPQNDLFLLAAVASATI